MEDSVMQRKKNIITSILTRILILVVAYAGIQYRAQQEPSYFHEQILPHSNLMQHEESYCYCIVPIAPISGCEELLHGVPAIKVCKTRQSCRGRDFDGTDMQKIGSRQTCQPGLDICPKLCSVKLKLYRLQSRKWMGAFTKMCTQRFNRSCNDSAVYVVGVIHNEEFVREAKCGESRHEPKELKEAVHVETKAAKVLPGRRVYNDIPFGSYGHYHGKCLRNSKLAAGRSIWLPSTKARMTKATWMSWKLTSTYLVWHATRTQFSDSAVAAEYFFRWSKHYLSLPCSVEAGDHPDLDVAEASPSSRTHLHLRRKSLEDFLQAAKGV
ncbi:hypothetical protein C8J57DRAFT_1238283 [Mycena rebaudengoi]|nr:hypothetical protein C8J57DRAFT_1238283 [Mycena rebaudengoi]